MDAEFPVPDNETAPNVLDVLMGKAHASALDAPFWDANSFRASSLQNPVFHPVWDVALEGHPRAAMIRRWLVEGVRPSQFWCHYKGRFKGVDYDGDRPPRRRIRNNPSALSDEFVGPEGPNRMRAHEFVSSKIAANVVSGALMRWCDHPDYDPVTGDDPHLVLPLGVEPDKPRMLWDARLFNLFQRKIPFTMEGLGNVPTMAIPNARGFVMDHHSGFGHVGIASDEQTYFGCEWQGVIYVACSMNFGWCHAPMIYNTLTHVAVAIPRACLLRNVYYTDDIFGASTRGSQPLELWISANDAVYITAFVMFMLGYTIAPKSMLCPKPVVVFLGMEVRLIMRCFRIPPAKMTKFLKMLTHVMEHRLLSHEHAEKLAGRAVSFSYALPGVMFFTRGLYRALATIRKQDMRPLAIGPTLGGPWNDLTLWTKLEEWNAAAQSTWPKAHHVWIQIFSDASTGKGSRGALDANGVPHGTEPRWGGTIDIPGQPRLECGGHFEFKYRNAHINFLEILGLLYTLQTFAHLLAGAHVEVGIDNTTGLAYYANDGGRDEEMMAPVLEVFKMQLSIGFQIFMRYVSTHVNPADEPSRSIDRGDHRLNPALFAIVWNHPLFGQRWPFSGFTIDWMACGRNAQCDPISGKSLPYFSFMDEPGSGGVNFLAQVLSVWRGMPMMGYINPPWRMIPAALAYLRQADAIGVIIVPQLEPPPAWWATVMSDDFATARLRLSAPGEHNVFLQPSRDYLASVGPCPFAVWAVAFDFS